MSQLPPKAIDEFQALWKEHYGTELSREDATMRAHQVFTLVRMLVERPRQSQASVPAAEPAEQYSAPYCHNTPLPSLPGRSAPDSDVGPP